jgi:hypothetical protein
MSPIIFLVLDLHELEERLIAPQQAFAQIWQVEGYGQYKIQGSIINVPTNVNITQSILPRMPNDEATISIILKRRLEYESLSLSGKIGPNQMMLALKNLMKTPLYIDAKISMTHVWENMFNIAKHQQIKNNLKTSQDIEMDIEQDLDTFEEMFENVTTNSFCANVFIN